MKVLRAVPFALVLVCSSHAQKDIQRLTIGRSPTAFDAVLPISIWANVAGPAPVLKTVDAQVVGTGFVIDKQGDFITAGHVIDSLKAVPKDPKITNVRLTATLRQRNGDGSAQEFTITDRDYDHDLVLCHVAGIAAVTPAKSHMPKNIEAEAAHPFASLAISTAAPKAGQFVIVSGFPLGSWTPTIQFGMVSSIKTINPSAISSGAIRKDGGELLQISVNANHGNSGGPVIDLESGQVIGVIDQVLPAPLQFAGKQILDANTFSSSGIMLASPAKWVEALLKKNHIKSEDVQAGKLVGW